MALPEHPPERSSERGRENDEHRANGTPSMAEVLAELAELKASVAELHGVRVEVEQATAQVAEIRLRAAVAEADRDAAKAIASAEVEAMRKQLESGLKAMEAGIAARNAVIEEVKETLDHERARSERLETMLALVEGWVDDVVTEATAPWMPAAVPLAETVRRRRATGGPAEATFATLVGLELRPRRLRDASTLWGSLRSRQGAAARDAVWAHPDLIPGPEDLDDPLGFKEAPEPSESLSDADFDAALSELLDRPDDGPRGGDDTGGEQPRQE